MSSKVSLKLLLASLAACIVGIGTSHARPIDPGTELVSYGDGQAFASPQEGQLQFAHTTNASSEPAPGFHMDLALLSNYSGLRNELIKYSWPVQPDEPLLTGTVEGSLGLPGDSSLEITTSSVGVPEPGTLALLALGLVGVALIRRRHTR